MAIPGGSITVNGWGYGALAALLHGWAGPYVPGPDAGGGLEIDREYVGTCIEDSKNELLNVTYPNQITGVEVSPAAVVVVSVPPVPATEVVPDHEEVESPVELTEVQSPTSSKRVVEVVIHE